MNDYDDDYDDTSEVWIRDCKESPVCPECGGTNLQVVVRGDWNEEMMEWEIDYDSEVVICQDCSEEFYE